MLVTQKAEQISFAIIKISVYVRRRQFRELLEAYALKIAEEAGSGAFSSLFKSKGALESLIRLGKEIYEIEPVNAGILLDELNALRDVVEKAMALGENQAPSADIGHIFRKEAALFDVSLAKRKNGKQKKSHEADNQAKGENAAIAGLPNSLAEVDKTKGSVNVFDNAAMRQSAIIIRMRQFDNSSAQLKELVTAFPEVSERTLRYDLQSLCASGALIRVGAGGPGTYYELAKA